LRRRFVIAGDLDLTINKMGASFERGREEFGCVRAGRVEAEEVTLRWHVRRGIIKPGGNLCKAA
jgi:hypothetical protein